MIPLIATVDWRTKAGSEVRLWLPLFLIWLILLPLFVLLVPIVAIVAWTQDVPPFRALSRMWGILAGLRGLNAEIAHPKQAVFIRIV